MIDYLIVLAQEAGEICQESFGKLADKDVEFKNAKDLVTEVDRKVEDHLRERLGKDFPEHAIVGEERGESGSNSQHCWIIDPIDGTVSFVHGLPGYSVSLAYQENSTTVAGVVYAPELQQLFSAEKGAGSYLNGMPIGMSNTSKMVDSVWATGFSCLRSGLEDNNLKHFNRIVPGIRDFRRMGSAALDLAYVSAGKLDGFWEMNLNIYDVAAGILLVEEVGGVVCDMAGGKNYPGKGIVATNPQLLSPFLELLQHN